MPLLPSSSSSFFAGTMSRTSVSQSSVVQFQPADAGHVPLIVRGGVDVDFDDADAGVGRVLRDPVGGHENVGTRVGCHAVVSLPFGASHLILVTRLEKASYAPGAVWFHQAMYAGRGLFEILQLARMLDGLARRRHDVADALPDEQQLAAALVEQLRVQHAARQERRHHLPVGGDHPVRRVRFAARRDRAPGTPRTSSP